MAKKLTVYTTPLCAPCETLKRILKTEGLAFETKDLMVDDDAAGLLESLGIRTSPALAIDGEIYAGDDLKPERLVALLDL
ncbi:MAG: glutaredoxin domain-containing protein [bacterium]|nr:glutaredoxin family protein [Gammaproteobacteria bacterium]HIL96021.1 glutaredoxin family protein [Pseudomonadales bacterium]